VPSFREAGGANLDWNRGIPHREGAYTFTHSGTTVRRAFPGLDADEQVRHKGELVYPNLFLSVACDHVAAFILQPRGAERRAIRPRFGIIQKKETNGTQAACTEIPPRNSRGAP
jgi:hypothetical protein